jgi:DNA-binding response OmpR family regulator
MLQRRASRQFGAHDAAQAFDLPRNPFLICLKPFRSSAVTWNAHHGSMTARLKLGNLTIDRATYLAWIDGRPIDLTYIEFEILYALARNQHRVISREAIARSAWGDAHRNHARNLTVHISRLRKKLTDSHPFGIRTIPRRGYSITNTKQPAPHLDRELTGVTQG